MFFTNLASTSRLSSILPRCSRSLVNRAALRPAPPPKGIYPVRSATEHKLTLSLPDTERITTPQDFLTAIGRSSETKLSIEAWEEFWKTSGQDMKKLGLAVRDRRYVFVAGGSTRMMLKGIRYILWCMEKYRSGIPIQEFAHEPKPKKTVRG